MIKAQQNPIIYRFDLYENYYNPSLDAFDGKMGLQTIFKSQMTGVEGAPLQMGVGFGMPIPKILGRAGLETFGEKVGFFSKAVARFSYATDIKISKEMILSGGVSFNMNSTYLDKNNWILPQGGDIEEPLSISAKSSIISANLSTFVSVRSQNYKIGISVIDVVPSKSVIGFGSFSRMYNLIGKYNIKLSSSFELKQAVFYLGNGNNSNVFSFMAGLGYKERVDVSVSTNSLKNISLSSSCNLGEHILLSYAFDIGFEKRSFFFLSHEVYLRYYFTFDQENAPVSKHKNIRFL